MCIGTFLPTFFLVCVCVWGKGINVCCIATCNFDRLCVLYFSLGMFMPFCPFQKSLVVRYLNLEVICPQRQQMLKGKRGIPFLRYSMEIVFFGIALKSLFIYRRGTENE